MKTKEKALLIAVAVLSLCAGFFVGYKSQKPEIQTVIKEVKVKVTDEKRVITKRPDGTVVTEIERHTESESKLSLDQKVSSAKPQWRVGAIYKPLLPGVQGEQYGVLIERRIISELFLGVTAGTDRTVGLTLSIGF